ncbi:hypothetical protein ACFU9X_11070 [Streptomyces atratus]|uniref:hypothetical protein n=1 Tax=Streptomyces atratus TaxID=1893 RepID=UPI0036A06F46
MADRVDPANPQPSSSHNVVRSASCRRTTPLRQPAGVQPTAEVDRQRHVVGPGAFLQLADQPEPGLGVRGGNRPAARPADDLGRCRAATGEFTEQCLA